MKQERRKLAIPVYFTLALFALVWISPIFVALSKSLQINGLENYRYVLTYEKINYFRVISNSFTIAVITSIAVQLLASLAGYAFSKMDFLGKKIIFALILGCLAVPIAAVTMPMFNTINRAGLLDSHLGVIWPLIAFNAPFMLFMTKNYYDGIPNELLEAAKIDGASSFRTYCSVMFPLGVPIMANVLVLTFIYSWNDYLVPLLVMRSESNYTVTLAAQFFMNTTFQSPSDVARIYAVMMLLTLPSIIVYLFSQKFLQTGITSGAVKG